ncbi:hypothetical protein NCTGTJJY_CDS0201 [Serratia phage 92A1]|nr:hypothetical protein NCTGTJJY_CDS0201 [Serratia phage 92A1]
MNIIKEIGDRRFVVPAYGLNQWRNMSSIASAFKRYNEGQSSEPTDIGLMRLINDFTDNSIYYDIDRDLCNRYIRECGTPVVLEVFDHYQFEVRYNTENKQFEWRFANV